MKRAGNLFDVIIDRKNLRLAYHRALRGKRSRSDAQDFATHLERNLYEIAAQLEANVFPVGRFHQFIIHDPKERIITAPCFSERVVQHAIMHVCEPVFERWLIDDTYACRRGRGRIAALTRSQQFSQQYPFFLKMDIRKYFDSISQKTLMFKLRRLFKDDRLLHLFSKIIHAFHRPSERGLPIGSLTSQHFANFYLGWCDRFIKEELRCKGYVRYMDDMAVWGASSAELHTVKLKCEEFLKDRLDLSIHSKTHINRTSHGMDFLGCRVYQSHQILNRRSRVRFAHQLSKLTHLFQTGEIDSQEFQQRATSLAAFTTTAGVSSWKFRSRVLKDQQVSIQ